MSMEANKVITVKFKGKFALGTSARYPIANVEDDFYNNITELNKAILVLHKMPVPNQKRAVGRPKKKSRLLPSPPSDIDGVDSGTQCEGLHEGPRASVGGLSTQKRATLEDVSAHYSNSLSTKLFAKTLSSMDPAEMEVKCDFDFWLWIEAQKVFAPFSPATHDVRCLALLGTLYNFTCGSLTILAIGDGCPWSSNHAPSSSSTARNDDEEVEPDPWDPVIAKKCAELTNLHLQVNRRLSALRQKIQSAEVRDELSLAAKTAEREKSTISRWNKAKKKLKW